MSLVTGVGVSTDDDVVTAMGAAARAAGEQCPEPCLALAFVTHNYPVSELGAAAGALADAFPSAMTGGGQVNGVTFDDDRFDALFSNRRAVAVICFGGPRVRGAIAMTTSLADEASARLAGKQLAQDAIKALHGAPAGGVLLGLGLAQVPTVDQQLVNGVRDVAPRLRISGSGLCGGMESDGRYRPGQAFVGRDVVAKGALLALLGGEVRLGFSVANGMKPVGRGSFVSKVEGIEIVELDGRPAKDVVLDLLAGENPESRELFEKSPTVMSIERGIALAALDQEGDFYWCHALATFTPRGGAIDAFGPRLGMGLSVTRIDPESCMAAVSEAAASLREDAGADSFECTLAFTCALRGFTLGAEVAHEDAELRRHLRSKHHLGIIANGEIGCYRHGRPVFTGWVYALMGAVAE